jgi:beta-phosphoglucomutase-like phosphatase (HAD superfamily)
VVEDNENGIKAARASGAHLMKVENVLDVNLPNIMANILRINEEGLL